MESEKGKNDQNYKDNSDGMPDSSDERGNENNKESEIAQQEKKKRTYIKKKKNQQEIEKIELQELKKYKEKLF